MPKPPTGRKAGPTPKPHSAIFGSAGGETMAAWSDIWNESCRNGSRWTERSKAAVPVIPRLTTFLDRHRLVYGNPTCGQMFANRKGKPANLNNTLNREILPALNRWSECRKPEGDHVAAAVSHDFKRDDNLPMWHGWHAFRRGLASTLYGLVVDDVMVQQIPRRKDVQVTRDHYIKTSNDQSVAAMAKLESALSELCADRALATAPVKSMLPN